MLCIVDDAQWLDQSSALALGFVARRLLAEPVGAVFAAREPGEPLKGLPDRLILGLREGEARALLSSALPFRLDEQVRDRIVAETQGNPLALVELPRGLSAAEFAGFGTGSGSALSDGVEERFQRRLEALPQETRRLLLIAAADPLGEPTIVWRAAERQGIEADAGAPAEAAGCASSATASSGKGSRRTPARLPKRRGCASSATACGSGTHLSGRLHTPRCPSMIDVGRTLRSRR